MNHQARVPMRFALHCFVVVALAAVGCGASHDTPAPAVDAAVTEPLLPCALETFTEHITSHAASWRDCGVLPWNAMPAEVATAKACAESSRDRKEAFRLLWSIPGTDSRVQLGIVGIPGQLKYEVHYYQYDSAGTEDGANAHEQLCDTLDFTGVCLSESGPDLCVKCEGPGNFACQCSAAPDGGENTFCG